MQRLVKSLLCLSAAAVLSGCVSVHSYPMGTEPTGSAPRDCVDATQPVRSFEVVSDREVVVDYLGSKRYRVVLDHSCPRLGEVDQLGFATGPDRYIGHRPGYGAIYASPIEGSSRICGRGADRLVLRERFSDFTRPSEGCTIQSIQRLP
jgi:hypothetical protein